MPIYSRMPMTTSLLSFVAIDVEISSRRPLVVCAVGAVRFESGLEVSAFQSRVKVDGRVRFSNIHGLTAADLRDAPPWPVVWRGVLEVLGSSSQLVAYRAAFDRAAILTMCAKHGIRLPRLQFTCAAEMFQARVGRSMVLSEALNTLSIAFPGRPHDPLSDARAAALLVLAVSRDQFPTMAGGETIQLPRSPSRADRATDR